MMLNFAMFRSKACIRTLAVFILIIILPCLYIYTFLDGESSLQSAVQSDSNNMIDQTSAQVSAVVGKESDAKEVAQVKNPIEVQVHKIQQHLPIAVVILVPTGEMQALRELVGVYSLFQLHSYICNLPTYMLIILRFE